MNLRERTCIGSIKIGVVEAYSNGNEQAIRPFPMSGHSIPDYHNHADNVIKIIRYYVPNADIHLVPNTMEGIAYLVNNGIKLVNVSLSGYDELKFQTLSENAFIIVAAGNDGESGENGYAQIKKACCVGAVGSNLQPQTYSSYGKGAVKTCAIVGDPKYTGEPLFGTSFASPVVTGLIAQWYIWFYSMFGKYPSIKRSNRFVIENSHDVFEDDYDLKTGYGLLRLPKTFSHNVIEITNGMTTGVVKKYKENGNVETNPISLLATPFIQNGRMMASISDIGDFVSLTINYNSLTKTGIFID